MAISNWNASGYVWDGKELTMSERIENDKLRIEIYKDWVYIKDLTKGSSNTLIPFSPTYRHIQEKEGIVFDEEKTLLTKVFGQDVYIQAFALSNDWNGIYARLDDKHFAGIMGGGYTLFHDLVARLNEVYGLDIPEDIISIGTTYDGNRVYHTLDGRDKDGREFEIDITNPQMCRFIDDFIGTVRYVPYSAWEELIEKHLTHIPGTEDFVKALGEQDLFWWNQGDAYFEDHGVFKAAAWQCDSMPVGPVGMLRFIEKEEKLQYGLPDWNTNNAPPWGRQVR